VGRTRLAEVIAVDTSAIVAIVTGEPERDAFSRAIRSAAKVLISSVSVVETKVVLHGRWGERGVLLAENLFGMHPFEVVAPTPADVDAALAAFVLYGKGNGHPAALNLGDLFSYALAKTRDLPLLFKGNDFARTDLRTVIAA
jgi:ribonuclease VapC